MYVIAYLDLLFLGSFLVVNCICFHLIGLRIPITLDTPKVVFFIHLAVKVFKSSETISATLASDGHKYSLGPHFVYINFLKEG